MLDKLKNLSTAAKVGIAGGAVLLAAGGVGLGITQPWNQSAQEVDNAPPPVQQQLPQDTQQPEEPSLSVRAGNQVVPCSLYEGDGWSIYLPEGWNAQKMGDNNAVLSSDDGAEVQVDFLPGSEFSGGFVNLSADDADENDHVLQFFQGTGEGSPSVTGSGPKSQWDFYGKLFIALARTLTVGDEKPFGEFYIIPQEPDWQEAEGKTVLFLDKDGYIVDDKIQNAVESYMQAWPDEARPDYTGQYRVNDIQWASSYTGITEEGYIDVFRADVQYKLKDGVSAEDAVNGWARTGDEVYTALFHDGGFVEKTQSIVTEGNANWEDFAARFK